mmetsp:Transcript_30977/g.86542  ORF Transcript_30977/g.86542 Transcript_30977/m.86542 type:complete len:322 (-) Transcript_30977:333-1298(-)
MVHPPAEGAPWGWWSSSSTDDTRPSSSTSMAWSVPHLVTAAMGLAYVAPPKVWRHSRVSRFHTFTMPSLAMLTARWRSKSASNCLTGSAWPSRTACAAPPSLAPAGPKSLSVSSAEAVKSRPEDQSTTTRSTPKASTVSTLMLAWLRKSQNLTDPSRDAVAALPVDQSASMLVTSPVWPCNCAVAAPLPRSRTSMTPPRAPRNARSAASSKARAVTAPMPGMARWRVQAPAAPETRSATPPSSWPTSILSPNAPKATTLTPWMRIPGASIATGSSPPPPNGRHTTSLPSSQAPAARVGRHVSSRWERSSANDANGPCGISP